MRAILRRQRDTTVVLGEVIGIEKDERCVMVSAQIARVYGCIMIAARNKILSAFKVADAEEDPRLHRDLLTFVLVGAGPTGVEMASAIAVLVRNTMRSEFRRIDPASARIVLVDQSLRVLGSFSELSSAAKKRLEGLGVDVLLRRSVEKIDATDVIAGGERIVSNTVIRTAGVAPSPAAKWLHAEAHRAGRVRVQKDLSVAGHPESLW
jgi:NADH:ubiquinone reductase (H+-translocating)